MAKLHRQIKRYRLLVGLLILILLIPTSVYLAKNARQASANNTISFNEGSGTTIHDSQTDTTGTISGATWQPESYCVEGKCLYFDGTNDYVSFGDDSDFDFAATDSFTIELWFRMGTVVASTQTLVAKFDSSTTTDGGYKITAGTGGNITFAITDDSAHYPEDSAISTAGTYTDNTWHHLAAVKTSNSKIELYIDGIFVNDDTYLDTTGTLENTDAFYLGIDGDGTSNPYHGYLDQVKVYRSARSQAQINSDMTATPSDRGGAASFGGNLSDTALSNGLVGYWKFDETSGDAADSSGLNQTLTNNNSTPFTAGKFGNAADFTPASSHVFTIDDNASLSLTQYFTLSAWINPDATTASTHFDIAGKWDSTSQTYLLAQYGDEFRLYLDSDSNYLESSDANLSTGTWYHVTATYDGPSGQAAIYLNGIPLTTSTTGSIPTSLGDDAGDFVIGAQDPNGSTTSIDRQVSASNEDADEAASDASFNSTNATIRMQSDSRSGVRDNGGFHFNNVTVPQGQTIANAYLELCTSDTGWDDIYVTIYGNDVDNSNDFGTEADVTGRTLTTASVDWTALNQGNTTWATSPTITTIVQEIVDRASWSSGNDLTILAFGKSDQVYNFAAYAYDGNPTYAGKLHIEYSSGSGASNIFDGQIDEVRLYNRPFSPLQIQQLYSYTPNAEAYYTFNQGSGTTLTDQSGNGHAGTLNGSMQDSDYVAGKFGKGLIFDGSNDYVSVADTLTGIKTISFWINPSSTTQSILDLNGSAYLTISSGTLTATGFDAPTIYVNGQVSSTLVANTWQHVAVATDTGISASAITLGLANSNYFSGILDDVRIYNYNRNQKGVISDMNGDHPAPGSPVGSALIHYKFDEGYGTTANNSGSGGSSANGTITSGIWNNIGKMNKAITITVSTSITATIANPSYTNAISLWVYPSNSVASKTLVTSGKLTTNASSQPVYGGCTGSALSLNTWTHIVAVSESSSSCKIYQNGIQTSSGTTGVSFGTSIDIGGSSFTGSVDEFKFYNFGLDATSVLAEYNQGKASVFGAISTESDGTTPSFAASRQFCIPGDTSTCYAPVAEWKLDEKTGTTAYDTSSNSYNLTLTNSPTWSSGKYGSSILMNGTNSYLTTSTDQNGLDLATDSFSIFSWIKIGKSSTDDMIFFKGAGSSTDKGYDFMPDTSSTGYLQLYISDGSSYIVNNLTGTSDVCDDKWHYVGFTWDPAVGAKIYVDGVMENSASVSTSADIDSSNPLLIGGYTSSNYTLNGNIDHITVFNYARTPAQVAWDYNKGGPLARYRLDECSGTDIHDMSGNGYDGTLTIGATGTNTSAGTCSSGTGTESWNNGTTGKLGSAVSFDGTDDVISAGDLSTSVTTIALWIKPTSTTQSILDLNGSAYLTASSGTLTATGFTSPTIYVNGQVSSTITANVWQHIAVTTTSPITASAVYFGKVSSTYFSGLIDDICFFNYPLTPTQIGQLMTQAAVAF